MTETKIQPNNHSQEAPESVTIKGYYKGYSVMLTKRDISVKSLPLLQDAIKAIDWMEEHGFKPDWHTDTPQNGGKGGQAGNGKQLVTVCPIHNAPMKVRKGEFGIFTSHYLGEDAAGKKQYCKGGAK